jgi:hypothetical protein
MPVQSPDFTPRWVLGSLPEDPAEFQRVLAGRLHGLEQWVRAAHARINFTQPFILPQVALTAPFTLNSASFVDVGSPPLALSFTSAIRAQAVVLIQVDATATAGGSAYTIAVSVNGAAEINTGIVTGNLTNGERATAAGFVTLQLAAATAYVIKMRAMANAGSFTLAGDSGRTKLALIGAPLSYTLP